jgi:hypothetical protein
MIILRVAMGRGLLKETVKEINTMLLFAKPATNTAVDEECREVPTTIHEIPGTPADSSGTPVNGHTSTVSNAC